MADAKNKCITKDEYFEESLKSEYRWIDYTSIRATQDDVQAGDIAVYDYTKDKILYLEPFTAYISVLVGNNEKLSGRIYCLPLGVVVVPFNFGYTNYELNSNQCIILSHKYVTRSNPENGMYKPYNPNNPLYPVQSLLATEYSPILTMTSNKILYGKKTNQNTEGWLVPKGFTTNTTSLGAYPPRQKNSSYTGATTECDGDKKAVYRTNVVIDEEVLISPYACAKLHDSGYLLSLNGTFLDPDMYNTFGNYWEILSHGINGFNLPNWEYMNPLPITEGDYDSNFDSLFSLLASAIRFCPVTINNKKISWGIPYPFVLWCTYAREVDILKSLQYLNEECANFNYSYSLPYIYQGNTQDIMMMQFPHVSTPFTIKLNAFTQNVRPQNTQFCAALKFTEPY